MTGKVMIMCAMLIFLSSCSDKTFDRHSMSDEELSSIIDKIDDNAKVFDNVD